MRNAPRRPARARRSDRWRSRRARASVLRLEPGELGAVALGASASAISPSASRSRRVDCEPTPRSGSSAARRPAAWRREPWRAAGCSTATVHRRSPSRTRARDRAAQAGDALVALVRLRRACPPAGAGGDGGAHAVGRERGQERAGDTGAGARSGAATAMLGGEPSTAGRISVARVSPGADRRPAGRRVRMDCSTASRVAGALAADRVNTIGKRSGPRGRRRRASAPRRRPGAAGERDRGQRALARAGARRARRTASAAPTAGPARSRRRR